MEVEMTSYLSSDPEARLLLPSERDSRRDDEDANSENEAGGGDKSIGLAGSIALLTNNITGPGMVQIPVLFQQAGWVFPTIVFSWIAVVSSLSSTYLAKAITQLPGNKDFSKRIEFSNMAKLVFPRWLYLLTFISIIFNLQVSNISSIVVSAQTMDSTIMEGAKFTCGLIMSDPGNDLHGNTSVITSSRGPFVCVNALGADAGSNSYFGDAFVISLGFIITLVVTIPMGLQNLDENIIIQYIGFWLLMGCVLLFIIQFFLSGIDVSRMPAVQFSQLGQVVPTVVFNFGFLTTLPSWLNEKSPSVSVEKSTWYSVAISYVLFMLLGILGAIGLVYPGGEDLIAAINDPKQNNVNLASKIASFVFPSAALLSGIPVFSIIVRQNLLEAGAMNPLLANLFAVVFPWAIALVFYPGTSLASLINWSSAILFVVLNFCLPLMLYFRVNTTSGKAFLLKRLREEGFLDWDMAKESVDEKHLIKNLSDNAPYGTVVNSDEKRTLLASAHQLAHEHHRPHMHNHHLHPHPIERELSDLTPDDLDCDGASDIDEIPKWWSIEKWGYKLTAEYTGKFLLYSSILMALLCFCLQIASATDPAFDSN